MRRGLADGATNDEMIERIAHFAFQPGWPIVLPAASLGRRRSRWGTGAGPAYLGDTGQRPITAKMAVGAWPNQGDASIGG